MSNLYVSDISDHWLRLPFVSQAVDIITVVQLHTYISYMVAGTRE